MLIDVYDFDGTIYDGDSTFDFVRFCLRRHPRMLFKLPRIALAGVRLVFRRIGLTEFKSELFGAMVGVMNLEEEAKRFWQDEGTQKKLGEWFKHTPRDLPIVIASASPEFELCHAAKILGVTNLIGTRADGATGRLIGRNCKGAEKIVRIREMMGEYTVRAMYTDDAKADGPLLAIAREKYIVTHGRVEKTA